MAIEITFGLTSDNIQRIKEEIKRHDDVLTSESEKGWVKQSSSFWERMGEELEFLPLTLCLLWQQYELNEQKTKQVQDAALPISPLDELNNQKYRFNKCPNCECELELGYDEMADAIELSVSEIEKLH